MNVNMDLVICYFSFYIKLPLYVVHFLKTCYNTTIKSFYFMEPMLFSQFKTSQDFCINKDYVLRYLTTLFHLQGLYIAECDGNINFE